MQAPWGGSWLETGVEQRVENDLVTGRMLLETEGHNDLVTTIQAGGWRS
jgi:hypothetical protein